MLGAAVNGTLYPLFSIFFGEIVRIFSLEPSKVLAAVHVWAGLFLVLGVVSGIGIFLKVIMMISNITIHSSTLSSFLRIFASLYLVTI